MYNHYYNPVCTNGASNSGTLVMMVDTNKFASTVLNVHINIIEGCGPQLNSSADFSDEVIYQSFATLGEKVPLFPIIHMCSLNSIYVAVNETVSERPIAWGAILRRRKCFLNKFVHWVPRTSWAAAGCFCPSA